MKKFLSMLLAVALVLSLGVVAMAAEVTMTLKQAIESAKDGETVIVPADVPITETINVTTNVTVELKDGATITGENARVFHVQSGTLTLTGNGTVKSTHTADNTTFVNSSSVIRVGDNTNTAAGLVIDTNVTVSSDYCYGVSAFGSATNETVTVKGTIAVTGEAPALAGNGTDTTTGTTINIEPTATVSSANAVAIYHPQQGTLNITGGTIKGTGGIEAKGGTVNISGNPTIEATATASQETNNNGTSTNGHAIAAVTNSAYQGGPATFNISGGDIKGSVAELDDTTGATTKGEVVVTGGTFTEATVDQFVSTGNVAKVGDVYAVGASVESEIANAPAGTEVTVVKGTATVNGETVAAGKTAVIEAPAKPVYRDTVTIEIGGEKTEEETKTETETEANPNTGAPSFIGAAVAVSVLALGGIVLSKKK